MGREREGGRIAAVPSGTAPPDPLTPVPYTPSPTPCPLPPAGTALRVVKLDPDGKFVTSYPGRVVAANLPAPWLAVEARWVNKRVELDGLAFETGDRLLEYFSPAHPFNAFAVYSPAGRLRGWYANVTHPTRLDPTTDPPTLTWHDLYLDIVALPHGRVALRDEDELAASNLALRDPALHAAILAARDELLRRLAAGEVPFVGAKASD